MVLDPGYGDSHDVPHFQAAVRTMCNCWAWSDKDEGGVSQAYLTVFILVNQGRLCPHAMRDLYDACGRVAVINTIALALGVAA